MIKFFQKKYTWTFTTYFTEGFPYSIIRTVSAVFFRDKKVSLENIGLTSLFGLAWILKFLWAPFLDKYSTKRKWLLSTQGIIAFLMILAGIFASFDSGIFLIAILFFTGSFVAATHDTAIDGYYLEALSKKDQSRFVGYRVMAYRIAMMTGTGVIVTIGATINWSLAFFVAAIIFSLFFILHLKTLLEVQKTKYSAKQMVKEMLNLKFIMGAALISLIIYSIRFFFYSSFYTDLKTSHKFLQKIWFSHWIAMILLACLIVLALFRKTIKAKLRKSNSKFSLSFFSFINRDKIWIILVFIIFLRAGEYMLTTMVSPLIVDLGMKMHYGWISAGVGLPASIFGALIGGWAISKYGLRKTALPFILFQNLTNIIYMGVAYYLNPYIGVSSASMPHVSLVALVHGIEQLSGGMGTAVLMAFLMKLCKPDFKAAHYAIGSGLMAVSGVFSGVISGFTASWWGYSATFGISFLVAIPALIAIPFLPFSQLEKST